MPLFLPLLYHRSPLAVKVQRTAFRELPVNFRDDRVGFGEARLAVEQLARKTRPPDFDTLRPLISG